MRSCDSLPTRVIDELCRHKSVAAIHREAWTSRRATNGRANARVAALAKIVLGCEFVAVHGLDGLFALLAADHFTLVVNALTEILFWWFDASNICSELANRLLIRALKLHNVLLN